MHVLAWLSGRVIGHISEVALRRARLVVGWVTVSGFNSEWRENLSWCVASDPGQLSLAIPPLDVQIDNSDL